MRISCLILAFVVSFPGFAQDTFSIVAVDPETGEVGSAGATCVPGIGSLGGVILLSGIIPGRGGVNAQAWICINPHINLDNAIAQMQAGLSPEEIIVWLQANDACFSQNFNPAYRQYGIVDLDSIGEPRSAAFTGESADDWKGHITGPNYSIQGNILKGPEVLDSMESRFLATQGALAEKLMAAMQGANQVGADARCIAAGTSSTSAFLRVFKPDDSPQAPYLQLNVAETPSGVEPIDSLQSLFDAWLATSTGAIDNQKQLFRLYPNPARDIFIIEQVESSLANPYSIRILDMNGRLVMETRFSGPRMEIPVSQIGPAGVYFGEVNESAGKIVFRERLVLLD